MNYGSKKKARRAAFKERERVRQVRESRRVFLEMKLEENPFNAAARCELGTLIDFEYRRR